MRLCCYRIDLYIIYTYIFSYKNVVGALATRFVVEILKIKKNEKKIVTKYLFSLVA